MTTRSNPNPPDIVQEINFHRVHRIGLRNLANKQLRLIVTKFEHYKQKQLTQYHARHLKGTDYGHNDQFLQEMMNRHFIPHQKTKYPGREKCSHNC